MKDKKIKEIKRLLKEWQGQIPYQLYLLLMKELNE